MTYEATIERREGSLCIDWLMYKSYEFQRNNAPQITPERWRRLYFNQEVYEKIYQSKEAIDV